MNNSMKLINKIRIWSFILCFSSFGLVEFGPEQILLKKTMAIVMVITLVTAILTTFIVLTNSLGDYLNKYQKEKDKKKNR
ncbi:MAG: hypothetical protein KA748_13040 [Halomonas sp.]|nr:hypothetical protein [Halomonas sp.]MBP5981121.1 hypothetical protein [Halomonas sp.]